MKKTEQVPPTHLLIRRPDQPWSQVTEQITEVNLEDGRWTSRVVKAIIPILGVVRFVTPKEWFSEPLDFDGLILDVRIDETGETIQLFPNFRIRKLVQGGAERLVIAVHHHYERQLDEIRKRLDSIWRAELGMSCPVERLDLLVTHNASPSAVKLQERIADELGVLVEWIIEPEPQVVQWVQSLQNELAALKTLQFNEESSTAQFNLTFSAKIERAIPSGFHLLQRRVAAQTSPTEELGRLFDRIHAILDPAFGVLGNGDQVWKTDGFWQILPEGFAQVVARKVAQEFGYQVSFGDFRRERSPAEKAALKRIENSERLVMEYDQADTFYLETKERAREVLVQNDYDDEAPDVVRLNKAVENARKAAEEAQSAMEEKSQGKGSQISSEDSERFRDTLLSFHNRLGLGSDSDSLKLIGDSGNTEAQPDPDNAP